MIAITEVLIMGTKTSYGKEAVSMYYEDDAGKVNRYVLNYDNIYK